MKLNFSFLVFAEVCLAGSIATALQSDPSGHSSEVQGYNAIRSTLPNRTSIPVRLPRFIPNYADPEHPVFAIVESVNSDEYRVQLAWDKNCKGGNWCHLGEITGSRLQAHAQRHGQIVKLAGDIRGCFTPASMGAYCDDAKLEWEEGTFHYSIAMKCGTKRTLIEMARSAFRESQK